MPNDAVHRIVNYLMLSVLIVVNFYINYELDYILIIIFMTSYILGTEAFSPDLDTYSKPAKRLGILSYPIRKTSRHRGLGHNIFIGWLLKALYLSLIFAFITGAILLIAYKLGYDIYWIIDLITIKIVETFFMGLFFSNAIHILTDKIYGLLKR